MLKKFIRPPEAPVFYPTEAEFQDPIEYIEKIREIGEKHGICKIVPPLSWLAPFAPDPSEFKFTPRVQQLNKLDAKTRLKVKWMEKLGLFWKMKGPFVIPSFNNSELDLYKLNQLVEEAGGLEGVALSEVKGWTYIALQMGFNSDSDVGGMALNLASVFIEVIQPMNEFLSAIKNSGGDKGKERIDLDPETYPSDKENSTLDEERREGKRLKLESPSSPQEEEKVLKCCEVVKRWQRAKHFGYQLKCPNCGLSDVKEPYLCICACCQKTYHIPCLIPTPDVPPFPGWSWWCQNCVLLALLDTSSFGFDDSNREFTLLEFGMAADNFKQSYFKTTDPTEVNEVKVEETFWNLVECPESKVNVMYGADLHVMKHGSGFPTLPLFKDHASKEIKRYVKSPWNLNNVADLPNSLLRFVKADISGMKVPWLYVGMCFSTFCWHNEDHWTYSVNYLHFGEAKVWYGVPGVHAEAFERRMKEAVPSLFADEPDLLHQLVTLLNPSHFLAANVNVYRTDQRAGEFVVTFPRAYHAGFNQGFNFAEAVNFATTNWLQHGLESIRHYSKFKRKCVFSHEQMLIEMANDVFSLRSDEAFEASKQLKELQQIDEEIRKEVVGWGVRNEKREVFEEYQDDDDRTCVECSATLFLSALTCPCPQGKGKLYCCQHYKILCPFGCPKSKLVLLYRFTLSELKKKLDVLSKYCHLLDLNSEAKSGEFKSPS